MRLEESSIYINLKKLRAKIYECQFWMQKSDRIVYGTPLVQSSFNAMRYFIMAFSVKEKKTEYMNEMIGWFGVLREDLSFCVLNNIIHFAKRKPKTEEEKRTWTEEDSASTAKIELFELVAKIDEDMGKWAANNARGKSVVG